MIYNMNTIKIAIILSIISYHAINAHLLYNLYELFQILI